MGWQRARSRPWKRTNTRSMKFTVYRRGMLNPGFQLSAVTTTHQRHRIHHPHHLKNNNANINRRHTYTCRQDKIQALHTRTLQGDSGRIFLRAPPRHRPLYPRVRLLGAQEGRPAVLAAPARAREYLAFLGAGLLLRQQERVGAAVRRCPRLSCRKNERGFGFGCGVWVRTNSEQGGIFHRPTTARTRPGAGVGS